jgi:DNA-binding MarR family transcriptional regulator
VRDSVDEILAMWAIERPDLDFSPVGVITRLARVRAHVDAAVSTVFARFGLSPADFQVIVALRRTGSPYRLPQARLMTQLALTSGTISVRVDRLSQRGIVTREQDPHDARISLVRLTDEGLRLFDAIAPVHLANEERLLSALDENEREHLADLLRRLLVSFEHGVVDTALPLGLRLEPAHRARERRVSAGLSDTPGLLVIETIAGAPAAEAGVSVGDLLVAVCGRPVRSEAALHEALEQARNQGLSRLSLRLLRANDAVELDVPAGPAAER